MPITFTPPARSEVPPTLPEGHPGNRLYRYFRARPAGVDVFLYKVGSLSAAAHGRVDENDPITLYDSQGNVTSNGWDDLEVVFWGGHLAVVVTAAQAAALTAAGYSVDVIPDGVATTPTIVSISPSSGIATTEITLTGTDFTDATAVRVDGVSATFTINSATRITVTAPTHADGAVLITVTTALGTSNAATYTYSTPVLGAPPAITSLSPTSGPAGTSVIISGTNLSNVTSVSFGGTAATFTVNSSTQITTTAPVHADGAVSVTVTDSIGTSGGSTFTFTTAAPSDPHPGNDLLLEDGSSYLLLEDGTSSLLQES